MVNGEKIQGHAVTLALSPRYFHMLEFIRISSSYVNDILSYRAYRYTDRHTETHTDRWTDAHRHKDTRR